MTKTQYVIEDGGRIYRRVISEQEVVVSPEIMSRFAKESVVRVRNIVSAKIISPKLDGGIHMAVRGDNQVSFTVMLTALPMRARFIVDKEAKCLVPDFTSSATPMALEWIPPSDMRLFLVISMLPNTTSAGEQFLVAVDNDGRYYRLPTTNCYDNCKLCTGKYDSVGHSYADAIGKALNQFVSSDWQADLSDRGGPTGMANSKLMFRFKPLEPEGFEQQPPATRWTSLCSKINNEYLKQALVL